MKTLNIGILAHVDAGKTSLTERLLFEAGVISHLGSVDGGDTQTDSLALERRRGITIKSAVVAFTAGDRRITIVDTPGHADFIAEVERALRVLDGAILVVSAVEGVQAQTRVLMRTLVRLGIPVLIFVNKIDRMGADDVDLLRAIREKLSPRVITLSTVTGIGTPDAVSTPRTLDDPAFAEELGELLAEGDDAFLESFVDDDVRLSEADFHTELARQTSRGDVYPVLFGSAITGSGVADLVTAVRELFPATEGTGEGTLRATVFKIERGRAGEKNAYARLRSGSLTARQNISFYRRESGGNLVELSGRVSAVRVIGEDAAAAVSGDIARIRGLRDVRIGDQLGTAEALPERGFFAPPSLETVVLPERPDQASALYTALERLAEADPFIGTRRHPDTGEISVRLYGEVQKEIVKSTLAEEFGIAVSFAETRTLFVERLIGHGDAVQEMDPDERLYFWATVGIHVEPGPPGSGGTFGLSVELGSLPLAFHKAIEETVAQTLQQGLYGWEVIDCAVTLTRTAYFSPVSAAGDFRKMTPLVLMEAVKQAGTRVYEPVNRFELEVPAHCLSAALLKLTELRAVPGEPDVGPSSCTVRGSIPASRVAEFEQALPGLTQGEGVFLSEFEEYRPYPGPPPSRPRTGANPLDRKEYLLRTLRHL
ncbi:GTP-binding protein [Amycolatopsis sp. NPDC059027]|uniref:GTP-binding protein n=1 Tax=unclassified Amycolatopsis TaxID=2618356 RepID=UPI00366D8A21